MNRPSFASSAVKNALSFALCAALAPTVALSATKPEPEPVPLNSFKAEEPKKDAKKDDKSAVKGGSAAPAEPPAKGGSAAPAEAAAKGATTSPTSAPPPAPATAETPSTTAPAAPAASAADKPIAMPPAPAAAVAAPAAASASSSDASDPVRQLLRDITLTDAVIALFTLFVAIFAWRVSGAASRASATTQAQLDANRRAIEASERAAEAAKRSAEAAEHSAAVLQDTAARQLRPYVTVKEFLQGPVKDEKNFLHGWVFQVVWQNSGSTPTRGFRYWAALRQFDHDIPGDFDFAPPVMADFAGGELGSHSTVTSGTLFVPQTDVVQIQGGSRKAVLYGKAEYQDVLGGDAKRETRFAVEVILVADPGGANGTPFSFSYFPRHNLIT